MRHFSGSESIQPKVKVNYTFSRKFLNRGYPTVQNIGNYNTYDADDAGTAANRGKKLFLQIGLGSPDPDLDRHQNGRTEPDTDRPQNDADPKH
jgi:hypothetical protein